MYDINNDPDFLLADAAEILDAHNITLFVIGAGKNAEDAWRDLAAEHGERIAVALPRGGELIVSWHYDHKAIAWRIRQAFRSVGMRATWNGDVWHAVHVDLTVQHHMSKQPI